MTSCDDCHSHKVVSMTTDDFGIGKGKCIECLAEDILTAILKDNRLLKLLKNKLSEIKH